MVNTRSYSISVMDLDGFSALFNYPDELYDQPQSYLSKATTELARNCTDSTLTLYAPADAELTGEIETRMPTVLQQLQQQVGQWLEDRKICNRMQ